MEKIYGIEQSPPDYYGTRKYRFYSLYNGMRGAWCYKREDAVKEGERHQKIVFALHSVTKETSFKDNDSR